MFRRGASLPARPSIPNKEEILEDLSNASPDDVIYEYSEETASDYNNTEVKQPVNIHEEYAKEIYELEDEIKSASYLTIDSFLGKINCLKNSLISLEKQKTNLKILEEDLLRDMSRIKKELNADSQTP